MLHFDLGYRIWRLVRSRRSSSRSAATLQEEKPRTDQKAGKPKTSKRKAIKRLLALLLIALVVLTLYPLPALLVRYSIDNIDYVNVYVVYIIYGYSEWLQKALIFVHHVRTPFYGNLSDPSSYGLKFARQFELFHEDTR
jgi:hypothetical protein